MADIPIMSNRRPLSSVLERIEHISVKRGLPIVLLGPPGSGKSAIALSLARRLQNSTADFGACYINASNKEAPHIYGFQKIADGPLDFNAVPAILQPVPAEGLRGAYPILCPDNLAMTADGERHPTHGMPIDDQYSSKLTKSQLVPYTNGLVIVDEFTKIIHESVMGTLAGAAHEAAFGEWYLPKDTTGRVFIGNDVAHQSMDVPPPAHFINRCMVFHTYTDFRAVETHWLSSGMDPIFVQFAKQNTRDVFSENVPDTPVPFSTARSYELAWRAMSAACESIYEIDNVASAGMPYRPEEWPFYIDKGNPVLAEIETEMRATMASYCGETVATAFSAFALNWRERTRIEDILADPNTAKVTVHPGISEAVMAMCAQHATRETLSTICTYVRRCAMPLASVFCSHIKQLMPTVAPQNPDFMSLLKKCSAVGRSMTFGN